VPDPVNYSKLPSPSEKDPINVLRIVASSSKTTAALTHVGRCAHQK
jgi:hypothetical protein